MNRNTLTVDNISKRFGTFEAVRSLSLSVAPDEVVCLLGPSGCGKTTTLRIIAGLESVSSGRVLFGDRDVAGIPAQERNVAMAFQFYALYPDLCVADNLVFPLAAERLSKVEQTQQLALIAEALHLGDILSRYPHELSEGEKQRVAVGRCIIRQPSAFLFDEPLSRLDVALREQMRGSIRQILADLDRPTVIVTHDQLEAMTMGDRIAVMRAGEIEQAGRPVDIFDRPRNTFVASFIGTPQMTLLDGFCESVSEDVAIVRFGALTLQIPIHALAVPPAACSNVTLGFRPRSASLGRGDIVFDKARLQLSEHMGAEQLLHFDWLGQDLRLLTRGPVPPFDTLAPVSVRADDIHLFAEDGRRLFRKEELS